MKTKLFLIGLVLFGLSATAQVNPIPITEDNGARIMTGFESLAFQSDETTFVNAYLFVVDNVCSVKKDAIVSTDFEAHSFKFTMLVGSPEDSKLNNVYQMDVSIRIQDHRMVYYINNMQVIPGKNSLSKTNTLVDKLTPEKRAAHGDILADLSVSVTAAMQSFIDFVSNNKPGKVTHWEAVKTANAVKGLTMEEAKLAFGKPQYVSENRGEVQWMYGSSFYLFFKNGTVSSVIR